MKNSCLSSIHPLRDPNCRELSGVPPILAARRGCVWAVSRSKRCHVGSGFSPVVSHRYSICSAPPFGRLSGPPPAVHCLPGLYGNHIFIYCLCVGFSRAGVGVLGPRDPPPLVGVRHGSDDPGGSRGWVVFQKSWGGGFGPEKKCPPGSLSESMMGIPATLRESNHHPLPVFPGAPLLGHFFLLAPPSHTALLPQRDP